MILPGWQGVRAAELATDVLGLPVVVDNDANLGRTGRDAAGRRPGHPQRGLHQDLRRGRRRVWSMDGQIFRGPDGTAGEIGHASLDEYGAVCRCGNRGCLETLVRTPGAARTARARPTART